jgi:signal transduction histidine kinase
MTKTATVPAAGSVEDPQKAMTDAPDRDPRVGRAEKSSDLSEQRANILLVDDRRDKLLALEAVLAPLGENLAMAHSGEEALRLLLKQDFALIVLDVSMPGMDGFETALLVRQRKKSEMTPIIFISAVNQSDIHLSRGYSLGAVDYILAPIVPEILRAKVSFFIELHKKTEQLQQLVETQAELIREQAARAEAEAANQAKDRFLAMLSHELRTPLTPILFSSSILSEDPTVPDHVRQELKIITRNVELEARLIDDLLDLTRVSQQKMNLVFEIADVHDLLRSALRICSHEISAKNLTVKLELEAIDSRLRADSARLQQVFCNAIKNSAKFTPQDGQITLRSVDSQNGRIRIEVIDTGIGISQEFLPRIFDLFEQAGRPASGGLGLGLPISKAIVELHGGKIWASSVGSGRGATFIIELPSMAPDLARSSSLDKAATPAAGLQDLGSRRRILLVDDHADSIRPMQSFLKTTGYEVRTADSVEAALRVLGQESFDLLVSDIGLPDGSGEDLLRRLRNKGLVLPSIALSGYGMEEDIARSRGAGFQIHLTKPVSPEDLQTAIEQLVKGLLR